MGQFKPMIKMETTEPSVILKLKKGGTVAHKKMKGDDSTGHKSGTKMADGGMMGALSGLPALVKGPVAPVQRARVPARPSMAARRAAMSGKTMKEGGESAATHKAEMKKINKVESELKSHEGKKASSAHKGLKKGGACYKTGGVVLGNGGGYKTGGVIKGNGGGYKTGGVALGNAGGFKKGGSSKKAFASGGSVNDAGKATSMPQGNKPASKPVSIDRLSGTFKKGGKVKKSDGGAISDGEYASVMKAEKANKKTMIDPSSDKAFSNALTAAKNKMRGQGNVSNIERRVVTEKTYPSGLTDTQIDEIINSKPVKEGMSSFVDKKHGGKVRK